MPRTPAALSVKIDRLSRAAHRFHRFAHHPLCAEYRTEVVQIGRRARVCRGCLAAATGAASGLLASLVVAPPPALLAPMFAMGLLLGAASTFSLAVRSRMHATKLLSRFLPSLAVAFALGRTIQLGWEGIALAAAGGASLLGALRLYRRRGPDRTPCATCVERNLPRACRGIAPIVRRERAFRRLAGRWLARANA
jgi:hypothetical protein